MMLRRNLVVSCVVLVLVLPVLGWAVAQLPRQPLEAGVLDVPVGTHAGELAAQLREGHGMRMPVWLFRLYTRLDGSAARLQAGEYQVGDGETVAGLLARMVAGDVVSRKVVLVEGWTFRQVLAALHRSPRLEHRLRGMDEPEVRALLGIRRPNLEGLFLPDTYAYVAGMSDVDILKRAHARMNALLEKRWAERAPGLPYVTPYEALIAASLVEKETGRAEDRDDIAAVFVRRLRLGMRLQTDPTVIYALGEAFDGNLRRVHLSLDHPYNTYVYAGLPPSPIALAGDASLRAALNPASTDALFFVARGDGSSVFSATLRDHEAAVDRYQRGN
jgi:UPF0755 protein